MWLQAFNNRNAQKCAIAHLIRHSGLPELAIERRWGVRSCSAADSSRCVRWYVVHGRAESLSTDSAEGTVAPLRDLQRRGERIEEVQIAR